VAVGLGQQYPVSAIAATVSAPIFGRHRCVRTTMAVMRLGEVSVVSVRGPWCRPALRVRF
jgi:hypothetical protein